jgi:predicted hydrocarbon binding protein
MGKNGLNTMLNACSMTKFRDNIPPNDGELIHPATDFSTLIKGLIDIIGVKGARAIMTNAGRKGFRNVVEKSPEMFGLVGIELEKMATDSERISALLNAITYETNQIFGEGHQTFEEKDGRFIVSIHRCSWCHNIKDVDTPICYGEVGFDDEAVFWATKKRYKVREIACRAMGDPACVFEISE